MTHPNESRAREAVTYLLQIQGVFAASARGHAEGFSTLEEVRAAAEEAFKDYPASDRPGLVQAYMTTQEGLIKLALNDTASPFPPADHGSPELVHYLHAACNMLGPGHDDHVDLKVGEVRILSEVWNDLIVAVAIQIRDPGVKSLARGMRRARKKIDG